MVVVNASVMTVYSAVRGVVDSRKAPESNFSAIEDSGVASTDIQSKLRWLAVSFGVFVSCSSFSHLDSRRDHLYYGRILSTQTLKVRLFHNYSGMQLDIKVLVREH